VREDNQRVLGIEAMRYVGAVLVIVIHALPVANMSGLPVWVPLVTGFCRGAVPFFLIASGAFLPTSRAGINIVVKPLRRLAPIYLATMSFYYVFLKLYPVHPWHPHLGDLISGGEAFHLWFLPALGVALVIVAGGLATVGNKATGVIVVLMAAYSLSRGAYLEVMHLPGSPGRGGMFMAPLYVWIGTMVARGPRPPAAVALLAIAGSYALMLGEETALVSYSGSGLLVSHDFVLSTIPLGVSFYLLAASLPETPIVRTLSKAGAVSLTVYIMHLAVLWVLQNLIGQGTAFRIIATIFCTTVLATGFGFAMKRAAILKRLGLDGRQRAKSLASSKP